MRSPKSLPSRAGGRGPRARFGRSCPRAGLKPVPFPAPDAPEERPALSKGTIKRIQALRAAGYKLRKIGELLGIPAETARRYCKGLPTGKEDNGET